MGQCRFLFIWCHLGQSTFPVRQGTVCALSYPALGAAQSLPFSRGWSPWGDAHTTFCLWPWGRTNLHPRELHQSHQQTTLQINTLVQLTPGKRKSTESLISACQGSRNKISTLFPEPAIYWALLKRPTSLLHPLSFHKTKCKAWQCILMGYTLHRVLLCAGPPEHNDNLKYFIKKKKGEKKPFQLSNFYFYSSYSQLPGSVSGTCHVCPLPQWQLQRSSWKCSSKSCFVILWSINTAQRF